MQAPLSLADPPLGLHLWCWPLDVEAPATMLDEREIGRSSHLAFARDRRYYVAAHAGLRSVLATEAGWPAKCAFEEGLHGKPALPAGYGLGFNLSHSGGWALLATRHGAEVGADIELMREVPDLALLAREHLSGAERQALAAHGGRAASHDFLVAWTRKEACLKALGVGVGSVALNKVDAGVGPERREVGVRVDSRRWAVEVATVIPGPGLIGAVAVVGGFVREAVLDHAG